MRRNVARTIESVLIVALVIPAGMLLADTNYQPPMVTSSKANWYDVEQASNKLHQMKALSLKVRNEVARLQVQNLELDWSDQAARLASAKADVNKIGDVLAQLNQMKTRIEPWQQSLLEKVTPRVHEMVYNMDAALKALRANKNRYRLALSEYPQNINMIERNANQTAGTIGTVTQYAHAEQKMAALRHPATNKASS